MRKMTFPPAGKFLLALALLLSCGSFAGAQQNTVSPPLDSAPFTTPVSENPVDPGRPALQHRGQGYRLCVSDVISITFPLTPEFNQTVSVQPDGTVSLGGAGIAQLEGLTTQQSVAAIQAAYAVILRDPVVIVELKEFNKPYFIVSGQVHKPGKFDLRGDTSAAQAVAIAGGFNEAAKHSQVLLFRRKSDDWYEVKPLNLKRILQGHDITEDPEMRPGDMLFVPQNFISKIKKFIPSSGLGAYFQMQP